jgi:hypothetical protein
MVGWAVHLVVEYTYVVPSRAGHVVDQARWYRLGRSAGRRVPIHTYEYSA